MAISCWGGATGALIIRLITRNCISVLPERKTNTTLCHEAGYGISAMGSVLHLFPLLS
jgi:hypothetical protein